VIRLDEPATNGTGDRALEGVSERLFVTVARLVRRLRKSDPTSLGPGSTSALATIVTEGPMRVGDLATVEGVRAPTMTRIVDLLVTEGDVERIPDPADGRACLVRATDAGSRALSGSRTAKSHLLTERLSRLSPDALATIVAALPALEALCVDESPEA
jgi:DNA-binding MarR family transcriptional regulator